MDNKVQVPFKVADLDDSSEEEDSEAIGVTLTKAAHLVLNKTFNNVVPGVKSQIGYEDGESESEDSDPEAYKESSSEEEEEKEAARPIIRAKRSALIKADPSESKKRIPATQPAPKAKKATKKAAISKGKKGKKGEDSEASDAENSSNEN